MLSQGIHLGYFFIWVGNLGQHTLVKVRVYCPGLKVIATLKDIVEKKIAAEVRESEIYTLMVDGSTDKSNEEIMSMVCRYIVEGAPTDEIKVVEHVVRMADSPDRSANGLFSLVKSSLIDIYIYD